MKTEQNDWQWEAQVILVLIRNSLSFLTVQILIESLFRLLFLPGIHRGFIFHPKQNGNSNSGDFSKEKMFKRHFAC